MNNGTMIESQEGKATLEDVDFDTFCRFCDWAYRGDYYVENKADAQQSDTGGEIDKAEDEASSKVNECYSHGLHCRHRVFKCSSGRKSSCRACRSCGSYVDKLRDNQKRTARYCSYHNEEDCEKANSYCWYCGMPRCIPCSHCGTYDPLRPVQESAMWEMFREKKFHATILEA